MVYKQVKKIDVRLLNSCKSIILKENLLEKITDYDVVNTALKEFIKSRGGLKNGRRKKGNS